jgi:broad specificity phosphatase PhoE
MKIIFARHGESQANTAREISNRGLKHPLTQTGREQASLLAHKIEGQSITRIYSSPVLRAIETSIVVAHHLGVEYEVSEALREYDVGHLEGRADKGAWQLWRELFDAWAKDRRWEQRLEGGESFNEVRDRFVPFIDGLIQQYQDTEARLLCVGHGGLYWMMLPLVLRNIDTEFLYQLQGFPYTAMIVSELTPEGLVCVEWDGKKIRAPGQDEAR